MAENKTQPTETSVADFIAALQPDGRRADALALDALFSRVTGQAARMWGPSIIGYGSYAYRYESGREGRMCRSGFSPRAGKHTLYVMGSYFDPGSEAETEALLARLGRHRRGKGCLYITKLADVDSAVLEDLVRLGWQAMKRAWPQD